MSNNQTATTSNILPNTKLAFNINIQQSNLLLPMGIQSFCYGIHGQKWLLLTGRTSGLHGFSSTQPNFPADEENVTLTVINNKKKYVKTRSLIDPKSGLTQSQIDSLSVTNAQFYQEKNKLYIAGGYGIDTNSGTYGTKPLLTMIDIPGLIDWVETPTSQAQASQSIKQINDPIFQITGGFMTKIRGETLLVYGQDFEGSYLSGPFTQTYSQQIRRFKINKNFTIDKKSPSPPTPNPNYNRRDLNVVPRLHRKYNSKNPNPIHSLVAYSGVFTPNNGIWTVPVEIDDKGHSQMADPNNTDTFKQGMNNYQCANVGLYSKKHNDMYTIFFGGLSYGYYQNGQFQTDPEIPFINQCTTVKINSSGQYKQYLMDNQYPTIISPQFNPGNTLLFGTDAEFIIDHQVKTLTGRIRNRKIIDYDSLKKGTNFLGYIVGGIASTLPNTNTTTDSFASYYIFEVSVFIK